MVTDGGEGARGEDVHVDDRAFDTGVGRGGGREGGRVDEDRVVPDDSASVEVDVERRVMDPSTRRSILARRVDVDVMVRPFLALGLGRRLALGPGVHSRLLRGDPARLVGRDWGGEGDRGGGVDDGQVDGRVADPGSAVEVGGVGALDLVADTGREEVGQREKERGERKERERTG